MSPTEALEVLRAIANTTTDDPPWVYADATTLAMIAAALDPVVRGLSGGHYCPCGWSREFHGRPDLARARVTTEETSHE